MSKIRKIVDLAIEGNAVELQKTLATVLHGRANEKINELRPAINASLFGVKEETDITEAKKYVIRSKHEKDDEDDVPLYWHNKQGWVDRGSAHKFSEDEKQKLNLPTGGEWVEHQPKKTKKGAE
jgi:hypothetical protein